MKLLKKLFFFALAFLFTLFALDRFILYAYIENTSPTDFTEEFGRCRVKNKQFVYFNEGFGIGRFNEGRYTGHYYHPEKTDSIIRIAVLGDSYVEGFQVFERNHFITILENALNKNFPDSFQVMNFGRSGFDFGDMYAYYDRVVKLYNCNIVLFFVSNSDLDIKQTDVLIPKVVYDSIGNLTVTNDLMPASYLKLFMSQLKIAHKSVVFQMINKSRKLIKAGVLKHKLLDKFAEDDMGNEKEESPRGKSNNNVSQLSYDILKELENKETKFFVVNRGNEELSKSFVSSIPQSISYLDLFSDSDLYKDNIDPHTWKATKKRGHWNREGHEIVSEFLLEKVVFNISSN